MFSSSLTSLTSLLLLTLTFAPLIFSRAVPEDFLMPDLIRRESHAQQTKRTVGGVTLSTGKNFSGQSWSGAFPLEECIALNGFAGITLSFQPDAGTECYLMQNRCDAESPYADLYNNSTDVGDLSDYAWIAHSASYICFEPIYYSRVMRMLKGMARVG